MAELKIPPIPKLRRQKHIMEETKQELIHEKVEHDVIEHAEPPERLLRNPMIPEYFSPVEEEIMEMMKSLFFQMQLRISKLHADSMGKPGFHGFELTHLDEKASQYNFPLSDWVFEPMRAPSKDCYVTLWKMEIPKNCLKGGGEDLFMFYEKVKPLLEEPKTYEQFKQQLKEGLKTAKGGFTSVYFGMREMKYEGRHYRAVYHPNGVFLWDLTYPEGFAEAPAEGTCLMLPLFLFPVRIAKPREFHYYEYDQDTA